MILSYIEVILPPLFPAVPGIKMGLANIIIVFLLYRRGPLLAGAVSLVRILLVALLFGNTMSLMYSLAGGVLSFIVMILLRRLKFLSTVGVSVAGGVFHNVGQILAAMVLLDTNQLAYYLVMLIITGTVSGIFIGLCGATLVKRVPQKF
ncbi:MAG: Gx transporter family protein [Ruminococcaceae bacterium]|jgi:heptaprenyl diphosphate synthase|nr:Gx transporter family protein [Oscillospiraceae bacterium]